MSFLVVHEPAIRLAGFVSVFLVLAILEVLLEARPLRLARSVRWRRNLGITVLNTAILRLLFPAGATAAAMWASSRELGIFNQIDLSPALESLLAFIALDLVIYLQHVVFHAVPTLFRLHQVHHADLDFDVSLGTRFHPLEMVLSMGIKFGAVVVLGAPVMAVVLFELMLNLSSLFTHANVMLPRRLDGVLRGVIVTPHMHRVHHSSHLQQTNSNYGFCLSIWDRIFSTYQAVVNAEREIDLGLAEYRDPAAQTLKWMLTLPFRSVAGGSHADADHSERPTLWHRAKL